MDVTKVTTFFKRKWIVEVLSIGLILCSFISWGKVYGKTGFTINYYMGADPKQVYSKTVPIKDINKLQIECPEASVYLRSSNSNTVKIVYKKSNLKDNYSNSLSISNSDKTLTVKQKKINNKRIISVLSCGNIIEITLPKSYKNDLSINSGSGDAIFNSYFKLNKINVTIDSGDLQCGSLEAKLFFADISSGDLIAQSLKTNTYNITLSSGDAKINGLYGAGRIKASSGEVDVRIASISSNSNISSDSGDVKITLNPKLSLKLKLNAGDCDSIKANFPLKYTGEEKDEASATLGKAPYKSLEVGVDSGEVNVRLAQ